MYSVTNIGGHYANARHMNRIQRDDLSTTRINKENYMMSKRICKIDNQFVYNRRMCLEKLIVLS